MTTIHKFDYHAIIPKEMTSEMKFKIRENTHLYRESGARTNTIPDL